MAAHKSRLDDYERLVKNLRKHPSAAVPLHIELRGRLRCCKSGQQSNENAAYAGNPRALGPAENPARGRTRLFY